jgi:hypothetical protein
LYRESAVFEKEQKDNFAEPEDDSVRCKQSLALAQLLEYITDEQCDALNAPVFKLLDLAKKYQCILQQMDVNVRAHVNTIKLKERILSHFPHMSAQPHGKEVLLVYNDDIGNAVSAACQFDRDRDAVCLAKAANTLRNVFKMSTKLSGTFTNDCQEKSVPHSLLAFMQMLLEGPNTESQINMSKVPAVVSISQLVVFSSVKHIRKSVPNVKNASLPKVRHNVSQETPLPLYILVILHAETRKRDLVDKLFYLGLCISYDRLQHISTGLANNITECFDVTSGACPNSLLKGLFTTAAVNNVDHNPGSSNASDSLHGTGISLVQHHHTTDDGFALGTEDVDFSGHSKALNPLPTSYTNLPPVGSVQKDIPVPDINFKQAVSDKQLLSRP